MGLILPREPLEKVPRSRKARETYAVVSNNAFIEAFEIAQTDKPSAVCGRNPFKHRQAGPRERKNPPTDWASGGGAGPAS